ncbi:MAG: hypothetical protein KDN22_17265 [Verrucomicrobiae bacterium]|nr:hypothetical protein [Verrucomicrobiae bacterium]
MDTFLSLLKHQFTWGLLLGLLIAGFSFWNHMKTKRELKRYQRHLSDKLELEAKQLEGLKHDREKLLKENENLRLRVGMLNEKPDQRLSRNLEILTRAEKRMMINAPGFAAAWETAKSEAANDLEAEDRGSSLPKRLFSRLLGTTSDHSGDILETTPGEESAEKRQTQEQPEPDVKAS